MKEIAVSLAILSLALGGLPLFRRKSARTVAVILLIPKFVGIALAPYVALAGALGAVLGLAYGSALAIVAGTVGCALAANYVRRVSAPHGGFERAFGANWRLGREIKLMTMPRTVLKILTLAVPFLREVDEMLYQWEEPFRIDDRRFRARFGHVPEDVEHAAVDTVAWAKVHYRTR